MYILIGKLVVLYNKGQVVKIIYVKEILIVGSSEGYVKHNTEIRFKSKID